MKPHQLAPAEGARKKPTRVGRGEASGRGKTAGRGTKGTKARGKVKASFEGGQMPLIRRVPQLKGFKPPARLEYAEVNVAALSRVEGSEIGPEQLRAAGLVPKRAERIKVLGDGEIGRAVTVRADAFSEGARQKIEAAGGSAEVLRRGPGATR